MLHTIYTRYTVRYPFNLVTQQVCVDEIMIVNSYADLTLQTLALCAHIVLFVYLKHPSAHATFKK
jgi:hypothetical protein